MSDAGFMIINTEPRSCETIHAQCVVSARHSARRYIRYGTQLRGAQCAACGYTVEPTDEILTDEDNAWIDAPYEGERP